MLVHIIADYGPGRPRLRRGRPADQVLPARRRAGADPRAPLRHPRGRLLHRPARPQRRTGRDADLPQRRPPPGRRGGARGNAGERLAFARLPTGVRVVGVNAGHAFSFVRDAAEELRWAAVPPRARSSARATCSRRPRPPSRWGGPTPSPRRSTGRRSRRARGAVAYVDGYGNVKTTLRARTRLRPGRRAGPDRRARAGGGVSDGSSRSRPGSSPWRRAAAAGPARTERRYAGWSVPARRQRLGAVRSARDRRSRGGRGRGLIGLWRLPRDSCQVGDHRPGPAGAAEATSGSLPLVAREPTVGVVDSGRECQPRVGPERVERATVPPNRLLPLPVVTVHHEPGRQQQPADRLRQRPQRVAAPVPPLTAPSLWPVSRSCTSLCASSVTVEQGCLVLPGARRNPRN